MKVIALDVGARRIGVARADSSVHIAVPHGYIIVDGDEMNEIARFARVYGSNLFVIGLPRNNQGMETAQTTYVRNFAKALKEYLPDAKIRFQDESLTSVEAERRLKASGRRYDRGDIDAEAAAIILQDFLDELKDNKIKDAPSKAAPKAQKSSKPTSSKATRGDSPKSEKKSHFLRNFFIVLAILLLAGAGGAYALYLSALGPVSEVSCPDNSEDEASLPADCKTITFTINEGDSVSTVANNLAGAGLIKNSLVFQIYYALNYRDQAIKAGDYEFPKTLSVDEIIHRLIEGAKDNVFSFTILPGETIADVKKKLIEQGYTSEAVEAAFNKTYESGIFEGKPEDTSLEGYVFGETYEFYKDESVENILETTFAQLNKIIEKNDLVAKFKSHNLNLYQGITLASIIQKEAKSLEDQKIVSQIFYTRLANHTTLGSDVTVEYALNLIDPNRTTYKSNPEALSIDSPYNTRKYPGLPYGPICNPGENALIAAAEPADTDYYFFLTGDDGKMYYSNTAAEHNQNIRSHCQELCSTDL